jgi:chromate transporter
VRVVNASERVSLRTIFVKFLIIGSVSFGGGIVAYLQRMLVDETKWLTPEEFMATLEISQTMPGLNAVNMSVLVGDRLRGPIGSVVAALAMVLPGALFIFGVGYAAAEVHRATPIGHAALKGVAAGAVGLLAAIVLRTGKKQFLKPLDLAIVIVTFAAMSLVRLPNGHHIPLYAILLILGPISIFLYRPRGTADAR